MEFIHTKANEYVEQYSNTTPLYLRDMYYNTITNHPHSHLQSNWNQGGFLAFISKMLQPKSIIEIGTFTGFSCMCLTEGLTENGIIHTIELREEDAQQAANYFEDCPNKNKIKLHIGNAKSIIPTISEKFNLAFIDADKTGYIEYYEMLVPKMHSNGLIIADNVLFHGEVLETTPSGKNAKAIQAFNEHVMNDSRTENIMLTIRDGLSLIRIK